MPPVQHRLQLPRLPHQPLQEGAQAEAARGGGQAEGPRLQQQHRGPSDLPRRPASGHQAGPDLFVSQVQVKCG